MTLASIAGLKARDPAFDPVRFLEGARQAHEADGRSHHLELTATGRELYDAIVPAALASEAVRSLKAVTQTMPLVALTPLLVLMLGRGLSVTLWITISVTRLGIRLPVRR